MRGGGVSIRYARALLDIGLANQTAEKLRDELLRFVEVYQTSADLRAVLHNPSIARGARGKLIVAIAPKLRLGLTLIHFLSLLVDKDRMDEVVAIGASLQEMVDERAGILRAYVTSAAPMDAMQLNKMKGMLGRLTGKKIVIEANQDKALLGGAVTKIGGIVYDGSLLTQLNAIKQSAAEELS